MLVIVVIAIGVVIVVSVEYLEYLKPIRIGIKSDHSLADAMPIDSQTIAKYPDLQPALYKADKKDEYIKTSCKNRGNLTEITPSCDNWYAFSIPVSEAKAMISDSSFKFYPPLHHFYYESFIQVGDKQYVIEISSLGIDITNGYMLGLFSNKS